MLVFKNLIFLVPVFIFGAVTSFYDYKEKVIKNRHILIGIAVAIFFNFYWIKAQFLSPIEIFLNLVSASLIGFLLYFVDAWTAGDGKLFIVYSMFLPPYLYSGFTTSYPFLLNVFVPIFFVLIFFLILHPERLKLKEALNYAFDPYKVLMIAVVLFGFVSYVTDFLSLLNINVGLFVTIIILFFGFELLRALPFNAEFLFIAIAASRLFVAFSEIFTFSYAFDFFSLLFVFILFRLFFLYLGFFAYSETIKIEDLKEGMAPAEGIVKVSAEGEERLEKVSLLTASFVGMISQAKRNFIHGTNLLSEEDTEKLKELKEGSKLPARHLLVHKTIPFAVFLFVGYLLTIFLEGDFISFLLRLSIKV